MKIIKVKGMKCKHCAASARQAIGALDGVENVEVDLDRGEVRFEGEVQRDKLQDAVAKVGFELGE